MPSLPKVVVTAAVEPASLAALAERAEVVVNEKSEPWPEEVLSGHLEDAFGMLAFMPDAVDAHLLDRCPSLRIVAGALKGYDNFDVEACTRRGVWLTVVPDLLSAPTADLAIGLLLTLSRNLMEGDRLIRKGGFAGWRPVLYGTSLHGATVGILGMGAVGQEIARRLTGFGCRTVYFDQRPLSAGQEEAYRVTCRSFDQVVEESDFLVLALPLTERTLKIVDRDLLRRVKPGCLLINPARGSLVDEEAVADMIAEGRLGGYAADAFECEDLARPDNPALIAPRLVADTRRTVLTPHLGSAVTDVRRAIVGEAVQNIVDCLDGRRPRGAVNMIAS